MFLNKNILIVFLCLFSNLLIAQEKMVFTGDPDASFANARNLAFNKQRKQAQDTLQLILTKYPNYHDVRNFLATTYSWDGDYKRAKKEFEQVLDKNPKNKDAWKGITQNELWADAPFAALELSEKALKELPDNQDIKLLKAKALARTDRQNDALAELNEILKQNPGNSEAREFKTGLKAELSINTIGLMASADFYSAVFDPMQYYSLKYARQTKFGSIIPKINFTRKFETNAIQYEIEAYPKITKGLYSYVNFGYSNSTLFPKTKYGAELFKSLPKSLEASLGFRALNFDETTLIYTGSLGWYTGNNYLMFRTYITPDEAGNSVSGSFTFRKYRSDADNYLAATVGLGYSPEVNQLNYGIAEQQKFNLKSQKANVGYFFTSKDKQHAFGTQVGVTHQQMLFDPENYYWVYFVAFSWDLRFR